MVDIVLRRTAPHGPPRDAVLPSDRDRCGEVGEEIPRELLHEPHAPRAQLGMLVTGMAFLGAGAGLVMGAITPAMTVLGAKASPPALGAAFAVFNLAYATGLFVGPTLGGIVTDRASFAPAMLVLAATVLLVGVLAARRLARFGELCSPTSATDAPRSGSRLDDVGE